MTYLEQLLSDGLWDSGPLLEANRQLQQLRVYYRFSNAAVDRYPLNQDSDSSQQVIVSARELDQSALPRRSKTWQNSHFMRQLRSTPANSSATRTKTSFDGLNIFTPGSKTRRTAAGIMSLIPQARQRRQ